MLLDTAQVAYSACTVHFFCLRVHARQRKRERKRVYVLFPEKRFYPTHTINQLQAKQPLSNKDVLLPPPCWHTHTRNFRCRHTLSHTPLGFSYSRVFCLSPSVPGGLNEMRQKRKAVREKGVFLLVEDRLFCLFLVQMDPAAAPVATCPESHSDRAV